MPIVGHNVTVRPERRLSGIIYYRAVCSCGKYTSGLHPYEARAEAAGKAHADAKTAAG